MKRVENRILYALAVPALRIEKMERGVSCALVRTSVLTAALGGQWNYARRLAMNDLVTAGMVARYERYYGQRLEYVYAITAAGLRVVLQEFEAV